MIRIVDLSAPITVESAGDARVSAQHDRVLRPRGGRRRSSRCSTACRRACCGAGRGGRASSSRSARTTRRTSTRPTITTRSIHGQPGRDNRRVPLERFIGPAVVLDFTDREDGEAIDVDDMRPRSGTSRPRARAGRHRADAHRSRCVLRPARTTCDRGPGVTAAATRWLYDRGVRVMGIDAWGWDRPLQMQAGRGARARRAGCLLGGPSGRSDVFADRAARQPRSDARGRVHGRLLPAAARARERRARPRRRHLPD